MCARDCLQQRVCVLAEQRACSRQALGKSAHLLTACLLFCCAQMLFTSPDVANYISGVIL